MNDLKLAAAVLKNLNEKRTVERGKRKNVEGRTAR